MEKKKIAYVAVTVLIAVLAISNVWFFMGTEDLQDQVNMLETDKSDLETKIVELNGWIDDKEAEIENLYTQMLSKDVDIRDLNNQIDDLNNRIVEMNDHLNAKASQNSDLKVQMTTLNTELERLQELLEPNLYVSDLRYRIDSPTTMTISGIIINSGITYAYNPAIRLQFSPHAYIPEAVITGAFWFSSGPLHPAPSDYIFGRRAVFIGINGVSVTYSDLTETRVFVEWDFHNGTRTSKEVKFSNQFPISK